MPTKNVLENRVYVFDSNLSEFYKQLTVVARNLTIVPRSRNLRAWASGQAFHDMTIASLSSSGAI